jgi:HD-GYP domain-containing protein (c-di-GMP phosphodiesterase class II)
MMMKLAIQLISRTNIHLPIQFVAQHHERMDGFGYPAQIRGEDIRIEARILAVADVVEAMVSHHPYRPALGMEKALEEIRINQGVLYDTAAVDACLRALDNGFKFEQNLLISNIVYGMASVLKPC